MSVTFRVRGIEDYVNVSNVNARDILSALGIHQQDLIGDMRAPEFLERCQKYLESEEKEPTDVGLEPEHDGRYHFMGRPAGRLTQRVMELRALAVQAGDLGRVTWD